MDPRPISLAKQVRAGGNVNGGLPPVRAASQMQPFPLGVAPAGAGADVGVLSVHIHYNAAFYLTFEDVFA